MFRKIFTMKVLLCTKIKNLNSNVLISISRNQNVNKDSTFRGKICHLGISSLIRHMGTAAQRYVKRGLTCHQYIIDAQFIREHLCTIFARNRPSMVKRRSDKTKGIKGKQSKFNTQKLEKQN